MYECIVAANEVHIAPALLTDTTIGFHIEGWFVLLQLLQEQRIFPGYGVSVLGPFTFLAKDTCFTFPCRVNNRQGKPRFSYSHTTSLSPWWSYVPPE